VVLSTLVDKWIETFSLQIILFPNSGIIRQPHIPIKKRE